MPIRLGSFEKPKRLYCEDGASDTYARFIAEPFETGYGHTIGNSLRRILLSSLEGAAVTSVQIEGAQHEFTTVPGVVEDVTEIILNLKKIKFLHKSRETQQVLLITNKSGKITTADLKLPPGLEMVNPEQLICTVDKKKKVVMEMEVRIGRGFLSGDDNKMEEQAIGVIPIDSIFSPVTRVRYAVEAARVGQRTDYDKLVMDIWTDGRITPGEAMTQASSILKHHLEVFIGYDCDTIEFEEDAGVQDEKREQLRKLLNMSVNEIELSVRAANCLNNANLTSVGQLAMKSEAEMLKYRNFGKKSLNEIKDKLVSLNLGLGMKFESDLFDLPAEVSVSDQEDKDSQE